MMNHKISFANQNKLHLLKQILTIMGTIIFLLTIILDYILAPDKIFQSLIIRVIITTPFFIFVLYIVFQENQKKYYPAIISALGPIAAISGMISMVIIGGTIQYIYLLGIIFSILWTYISCIGEKCRISVLYNMLIFLSFIFTDLIFIHFPYEYRFSFLFFLLSISLLGYIFSRLTRDVFLEMKAADSTIDSAGLKNQNQIENFQLKYSLSPRERQVLILLLDGEPRTRIGEKLFISINTVKTHISSIYSKCQIQNRHELRNLLEYL